MTNEETYVDYELEVSKRLLENIEDVRESIMTDSMQLKIVNYAAKYDMSKRYVEQLIIDDINFAQNFAIDPGRQSIHEQIAANYLKNSSMFNMNNGKNQFKKLPASGKNAKYVTTGGVSSKNSDDTKSIDFEMKVGEYIVYATCKYTKGEGGAQDNQYADVKKYVDIASATYRRNTKKPNEKFIAIVDGGYYDRHGRKEELRRISQDTVPILSINEVLDYLEDLV